MQMGSHFNIHDCVEAQRILTADAVEQGYTYITDSRVLEKVDIKHTTGCRYGKLCYTFRRGSQKCVVDYLANLYRKDTRCKRMGCKHRGAATKHTPQLSSASRHREVHLCIRHLLQKSEHSICSLFRPRWRKPHIARSLARQAQTFCDIRQQ